LSSRKLQQVDPKERTREPFPLVGFPDGRLLMSVNPTLVTDPERRAGPARPELLEFSAADPKKPPKTLSPDHASRGHATRHRQTLFHA